MSERDIPIVMYHSINDAPQASPMGFLSFTSREFRAHLSYFRRHRYRLVTMTELWESARRGDLPTSRLAVLTFDDGYVDNLFVAADILEEFQAKATLFVVCDFVGEGPPRTPSDVPHGWGYLNASELRQLNARGVFDIQSHSMTHDWEFVGDRVVDFYEPSQFTDYYWLAWRLFPECKSTWLSQCETLKRRIPTGYPIFKHDRAIRARRFTPSASLIQTAQMRFSEQGRACLDELNEQNDRGAWETDAERAARLLLELGESKSRLEAKIGRDVDFLCFPGGAYDDRALDVARHCGYKAYMLGSRDRRRGNRGRLLEGTSGGQMIALSRISFSKDYPAAVRGRLASYLTCKGAVESFLDEGSGKVVRAVAKVVRNGARRVCPWRGFL